MPIANPPRGAFGEGVAITDQAGETLTLPPKFALIGFTGATTDGQIIAAVTGKKIRVIGLFAVQMRHLPAGPMGTFLNMEVDPKGVLSE